MPVFREVGLNIDGCITVKLNTHMINKQHTCGSTRIDGKQ